MGVIQSGLNQSLITTAALVSQSPAFQEAQKDRLAKREEDRFLKKDLPAANDALNQLTKPEDISKLSIQELPIESGKYSYINKTFQKAQDIALKRRDPGLYSQAYGVSNTAQESQDMLKRLRNKYVEIAKNKAKNQTDQINEIKQNAKYSEEDDFNNPYVGW